MEKYLESILEELETNSKEELSLEDATAMHSLAFVLAGEMTSM
ncbi:MULTISPECIES: hypothetical protein [Bacillus]|uniref:Uncharacterized protein n=1 Tax=Bacillus mycoides TaxID=1405 RepID=A0A3D9VCV5_BACMY|nr:MULTISPECIES: hypothetical protein [Bacillus]RBP24964.1 hypothetical protein DET63_112172 [Bacillus sp. DB-2]REF38543.1 hypothetical protein DET55_108172 [Bacillus mycoides]